METTDLIGSIEAARRCGTTAMTLRKKIRERQIPVYVDPLDGRRRLLRVADLEPLRRARPAQRNQTAEISAA